MQNAKCEKANKYENALVASKIDHIVFLYYNMWQIESYKIFWVKMILVVIKILLILHEKLINTIYEEMFGAIEEREKINACQRNEMK